VTSPRAAAQPAESTIARTIRIPTALRKRIAADAERCGRSFEGQVIALLRRHYGEDVDIAPGPARILALAAASFAEVPAADQELLTRKLMERELIRQPIMARKPVAKLDEILAGLAEDRGEQ
jgi:hypothetical protein